MEAIVDGIIAGSAVLGAGAYIAWRFRGRRPKPIASTLIGPQQLLRKVKRHGDEQRRRHGGERVPT